MAETNTAKQHPHARAKNRLPSLWMTAWLTLVWILLWGEFTLGNLVNGVLLALFVNLVMPLPRVVSNATFRPLAALRVGLLFLWDALMGALTVAAVVLRKAPPESAVMKVQLRSHSDTVMATTAGMVTLVPGSVVVEAHRLTGVVYLHVFDVRGKDPAARLETMRRTVLRQEERIMRAFSPKADLIDAGYTPGWRMSGEHA